MRISEHPILEFEKKHVVTFTFEGESYTGYEGEPIAAALHAAGVRIIGHSHNGRPRGLYCAIGNCSSCLATVNGITNVRTCTEKLTDGMIITMQKGRGAIKLD